MLKSRKSLLQADLLRSNLNVYLVIDYSTHSITFDNGGEFAGHEAIKKYLKCDYVVKPYDSWERGLNENTNGLLRRFFPKGMAIGNISQNMIEQAEFLINMRPRKSLNFLSPYEFLTDKRVSLIVEI